MKERRVCPTRPSVYTQRICSSHRAAAHILDFYAARLLSPTTGVASPRGVFCFSMVSNRAKATPTARRRAGIPDHRLNYVATRSAIEFGNSPFVQQHLRVLTGRATTSVSPVRLQVKEEQGSCNCDSNSAVSFEHIITQRVDVEWVFIRLHRWETHRCPLPSCCCLCIVET